MQCTNCGTEIPVGGAYCPTCGAVTPDKISASGVSPEDYTAASSPYSESPPKGCAARPDPRQRAQTGPESCRTNLSTKIHQQ